MRMIVTLAAMLGLLCSHNLIAQHALKASPEKWTAHHGEPDFSGDTIHLVNTSDTPAFLWAKDISFGNGSIEVDIKGKDLRGESFVGVAFHASGNETYDAIYFRPFNFRDVERRDRAVQYVSQPDNDWDVLREKHPGKYEHAVVPDTDPNGWFHIKIEVQHPNVRVYVNRSNVPTLEATQLSERGNGNVGLWIDSHDGSFKNMVITNDSKR